MNQLIALFNIQIMKVLGSTPQYTSFYHFQEKLITNKEAPDLRCIYTTECANYESSQNKATYKDACTAWPSMITVIIQYKHDTHIKNF